MKRHLIILLTLELFFAYNSYSEDSQGNENDVVFSEMTIDTPPGDDGSWIELYNRGEKLVKLGGYTIVCNNQNVFTFPDDSYALHPKSLLLINFEKNTTKMVGWNPTIRTPVNSKIVKTDPKITPRRGICVRHNVQYVSQRSPGYCALFIKGGTTKDNLIDYVFWGEGECADSYKSILGEEHNLWVKDKKLWDGFGGLNIGIDPPLSGERYDEYIAIQRKLFDKVTDSEDAWAVETLGDATPGQGNTWPPPSPGLISSSGLYLGEKLKIDAFGYGYDPRFCEFLKANDSNGKEKIEIRLQIAKDPHFEEIIYNKLIPPEKEIADYDFTPGTYYARVRIDMDKVCTDWSKALSFTYDKKETPEPEDK